MRIAVIGPGSMGLLYGGKLSEYADVTLIGNNEENIRLMCKKLIIEICTVANAEGLSFDHDEQIQRLENHLKNAPNGLTSIYSDLKNGRKTEVDYINGAVIRAAQKHKLAVPSHEMIVHLVHAMEGINR